MGSIGLPELLALGLILLLVLVILAIAMIVRAFASNRFPESRPCPQCGMILTGKKSHPSQCSGCGTVFPA